MITNPGYVGIAHPKPSNPGPVSRVVFRETPIRGHWNIYIDGEPAGSFYYPDRSFCQTGSFVAEAAKEVIC